MPTLPQLTMRMACLRLGISQYLPQIDDEELRALAAQDFYVELGLVEHTARDLGDLGSGTAAESNRNALYERLDEARDDIFNLGRKGHFLSGEESSHG